MTRIAPVRLMYNPKVLWFDAQDLEIPVDAAVVVTTARGTEYGHLADPVFEATPENLATLKTELKPVLRLGTEADAAAAEEAEALSLAAMPTFRELAAEESPEMRPIAVEYLLTCDKAVFYFEAENRIDFRELVRKLASRLRVRVDMRQIGSRDEARMMGGLGHCGQELCCKRLGGEFCPVSIRMAKEQNLSLNPQKISGLCGKLMCCLRYEYEAYKDFHARSPKVGELITTPDGEAKVVDLDVPREILTLLMPDDKKVKIALADMVVPEDGGKPHQVDPAAWEETMASVSAGGVFEAAYLVNKFTADSKLGDAKAVHARSRNAGRPAPGANAGAGAAGADGGKGGKGEGAGSGNGSGKRAKKKGGNGNGGQAQAASAATAAAGSDAGSSRRRRRGEARQVDTGTVAAGATSASEGREARPVPTGNRPGQKSSGIRGSRPEQAASAAKGQQGQGKSAKAKAADSGEKQKASQGKGKAQGKGQGQQGQGQGQGGKSAAKQDAAKQKPAKAKDAAASAASAAPSTSASAAAPKRREPRRRVRVDTSE